MKSLKHNPTTPPLPLRQPSSSTATRTTTTERIPVSTTRATTIGYRQQQNSNVCNSYYRNCIEKLLYDISLACRRTFYNEIVLFENKEREKQIANCNTTDEMNTSYMEQCKIAMQELNSKNYNTSLSAIKKETNEELVTVLPQSSSTDNDGNKDISAPVAAAADTAGTGTTTVMNESNNNNFVGVAGTTTLSTAATKGGPKKATTTTGTGAGGTKRSKIVPSKKNVNSTSASKVATKNVKNNSNETSKKGNSNNTTATNINNNIDTNDNSTTDKQRTWEELLWEASFYVPYMTDAEHGTVLHLASILLLGYLFPYSTGGNDYYLLQNNVDLTSNRYSNANYQAMNNNAAIQASSSPSSQKSRLYSSKYNVDLKKKGNKVNIHDYIMNIPLEERLSKCITPSHRYSMNTNSCDDDDDSNMDVSVDVAFYEFLRNGIAPLLRNAGRPYHTSSVDLLHILAMMIHPQPAAMILATATATPNVNSNNDMTTSTTNRQNNNVSLPPSNCPAWNKTKRLMDSLYAYQFQNMTYNRRISVIQMVIHNLIVPSFCDDDDSDDTNNNSDANDIVIDDEIGPLLYGSIQHLRYSLKAFAETMATSYQHYSLACHAIVTISSQTQSRYMKEDWDNILHAMVDDVAEYNNSNHKNIHNNDDDLRGDDRYTTTRNDTHTSSMVTTTLSSSSPTSFCLHMARGEILSNFILRAVSRKRQRYINHGNNTINMPYSNATNASSNETIRNNNNNSFLEHARTSLIDAIEWQMDCWTTYDDVPAKENTHSPYLLAGLLIAACPLFYYQHSSSVAVAVTKMEVDNDDKKEEDDDDENDDIYDTLIQCSIQLLRHPNIFVARNAANILIVAFSRGKSPMHNYEYLMLETIKVLTQQMIKISPALPPTNAATTTTAERDDNEVSEAAETTTTKTAAEENSLLVDKAYNGKANFANILIERLIAVTCDRSQAFAAALLKFLLNTIESSNSDGIAEESNDDKNSLLISDENKNMTNDIYVPLYRCLAVLCANCPTVVTVKFLDRIRLLAKKSRNDDIARSEQLASCIISLRLNRYFAPKDHDDEDTVLLHELLLDNKSPSASNSDGNTMKSSNFWTLYQMANHSLVTGNFYISNQIYARILNNCATLSEKYYLWVAALSQTASAESLLSSNGALGIPKVSTMLHLAVSYIQSLRSGCFGSISNSNTAESSGLYMYTFQIRFLLLRLDFLDLITILRQLTREMRLTGKGPARYTRSYLHLTNVIRGFQRLSYRYQELMQQHGMFFQHCANGIQSLRLLNEYCIFVSVAAKSVFSDTSSTTSSSSSRNNPLSKTEKHTTSIEQFLSEHFRHPLATLMRRLYELVIEPMDPSLDPLIRSSAMLELIDGILMAPLPYPRDFLTPKPTYFATLRLSDDPQQSFQQSDNDLTETTPAIEAYPAICFTFYAFGNMPKQMLEQSKSPIWTVVLWYRFVYEGLVNDDDRPGRAGENDYTGSSVAPSDENTTSIKEDSTESSVIPKLSAISPLSCRLNTSGDFYMAVLCRPPTTNAEGMYRLEARLGCRDATGNEWHIPVENASDGCPISVKVRVSRSK